MNVLSNLTGLLSFLTGLRVLDRLRLKYREDILSTNNLWTAVWQWFRVHWSRPWSGLVPGWISNHKPDYTDPNYTFLTAPPQLFTGRRHQLLPGHLHGAPAWFVPPSAILTFGPTAMALSAAASFSLSTSASLLTLLFIPASAPAFSLLGAWASAPASTFSFPESRGSAYSSKAMHRGGGGGRHRHEYEGLTSCFGHRGHLHERTLSHPKQGWYKNIMRT